MKKKKNKICPKRIQQITIKESVCGFFSSLVLMCECASVCSLCDIFSFLSTHL